MDSPKRGITMEREREREEQMCMDKTGEFRSFVRRPNDGSDDQVFGRPWMYTA